MQMKINIGIIGGAGYTGGELLRILLNHPAVNIGFVNSKSQAGKPVYATHTDLIGETEILFTDQMPFEEVQAIFLCSGHNESKKFLAENSVPDHVKIIDLSTDFRDQSNGFIYGLPELQKDLIKTANRIANPGCFATSIELALLPLASTGLLSEDVHVSAVTGSTGAGQSLSATTHFSWRNNNISIYKAFTHQHLKEINQSLKTLQPNFGKAVNFIPYRGNFSRGIMANVYTKFAGTIEEAKELYKNYYASHPFTHLSEANEIDLKQVVNTNKCILHLEKHDDNLLITSIIDNLTKGASGQAVQNLNLIFGLDETTGLKLKPIGF
ncbi:N-acetyl-gamma-glutamyl-phosphate reductase [Emticicia oligotrophica DSM 17448]|uniref:N-acetyl-gamma-glutamyl-phosphate reductase n=1 Tax=Emticicia oligotrophica (strain DSM 17448 / CIP 109782 / MTCC 6937 / GPTSA100-15) TaxID=929562 RepID=A0ABN4AMS3_EMTOG|nr:N-acetyl-gamma-glutamyl-phosphate reductase [Emticicia oligotrophica DSM 17448]